MDEKSCKSCGEFKPLNQYSVKDKASGRLSPTCKACFAAKAKLKRGVSAEPSVSAGPSVSADSRSVTPAERDPKGHELEPASVHSTRAEALERVIAEVKQVADSKPKPASILCGCGRYEVLGHDTECLRCMRGR